MAYVPRIYLDQPLSAGQTASLPAGAQKHLFKVLRLGTGDAVQLFNGDGQRYDATLEVDKKQGAATVHAVSDGPPRGANICLALGVSRGDRMDYALQKCTELGVAAIQPLWTERGNTRIPADRLEKKRQHWHNVLISASEQCGRCDVPTMHAADTLSHWIQQATPGFVLTPTATHPLSTHPHWQAGDTTVLVGPESGLGESEVTQALDRGWHAAALGPLILRTETAASVAVATLRLRDGML